MTSCFHQQVVKIHRFVGNLKLFYCPLCYLRYIKGSRKKHLSFRTTKKKPRLRISHASNSKGDFFPRGERSLPRTTNTKYEKAPSGSPPTARRRRGKDDKSGVCFSKSIDGLNWKTARYSRRLSLPRSFLSIPSQKVKLLFAVSPSAKKNPSCKSISVLFFFIASKWVKSLP